MVNSNADALGIIFPNTYDSLIPELVSERLMASIPFAGRYRMVDFILSSMVNSGIGNVSLIVRKNYHSLMDHLGSGREWDLTRKNGGLNICSSFCAEKYQDVHRTGGSAGKCSCIFKRPERKICGNVRCKYCGEF